MSSANHSKHAVVSTNQEPHKKKRDLTRACFLCFEFRLAHCTCPNVIFITIVLVSYHHKKNALYSAYNLNFPQPYLFEVSSDRPDEPDAPVHVGTPLTAPRHRWRDFLSALTAFSATRLASLSTSATSGLLDSMMTSCFKALCTPSNRAVL